ncbi:hypothetical protein IAT40_006011 [Kwoniella sp. CBS 6097]
MVKSQRSSTKMVNQWPVNSAERAPPPTPSKKDQISQPHTPGHHHYHYESSGGGFGTLTSRVGITGIGMSMGMGVGIALGNTSASANNSARTPILAADQIIGGPGGIIVPGSPSQTDPFGSQVTSPTLSRSPIPPTPLHSHSHSYSLSQGGNGTSTSASVRSRPPSTVLSSSSNSPSVGVVTPKIILASPSTSTIHYLFPSSDTKTGLHSNPNQPNTTTASIQSSTTKSGDQDGVRRHHSLSKKDRHGQRTSIIGSQAEHRDIPGIKNKRSLPSPTQAQPPEQSATTPTNVPAPTKKVVSASATSYGGLKKSDIGKPIPSAADEGRDYSKGYYDITPASLDTDTDADMGTLRRQPAMVDLSGKGKIGLKSYTEGAGGVKRKESVILKEIENRRERRGWEIGSKSTQHGDPLDPPSPRQKTSATICSGLRGPPSRPYIPPIIIIQQRRRSQSLSSPRPAPSPPVDSHSQISPSLPAPDFGDPLSLSVVIPSPSYSHLDYSPAGSSVSSSSQRGSKNWAKRASVIFPVSSGMMRGDTRKGLGGYDAGKLKAREDAEKRLTGEKEEGGGRFASLKRSVSLRKKSEEEPRRARPRSQSLGSRSIRGGLDSSKQPPLPPPPPIPVHLQNPYSLSPGIGGDNAFVGGLSIDLGSRYVNANVNVNRDAFSPRENTPSTSFASPRSADTSIFPASTPTSDCHSAIIENAIRMVGKPLHPAFNDSDISILAPSTVGLGFSPVGTPVSLPESLIAEVVDLTETGRKLSSPMNNRNGRPGQDGTPIVTPPTPQNDGSLPSPAHLQVKDDPNSPSGSGSSTGRIPRRSLLLAQNRFYLPPTHPKPVTGLQKKPSLRTSKSLGPGLMKRAYISTNVKDNRQHPTATGSPSINGRSPDEGEGVPSSSTTASIGRGLLKSASIRSTTRRLFKVFEGEDKSGGHHGTERMSTTPSMRFGRRPMTTFSLCSPSDAIDPLPFTSPNPPDHSACNERERSKNHLHQPHGQGRPHSTLRSNKSSPFLSASNSLRVIFGKEGFVARSLSQAFERDTHHASPRDRSEHDYGYGWVSRSAPGTGSGSGGGGGEREHLKSRISSPLEAGGTATEERPSSLSPKSKAHEDARESGRSADQAWRESVLQEAVSLSISSGLNKLAESPIIHDSRYREQPRMVSSGSKNRLAIPDTLLAAPTIRESMVDPDWSTLGETMMKPSKGSIESGLSLRAVVQDWAVPQTQRFLGEVGKEDSSGMVSAPSVYSNGASTYVEKPSRRLAGKGFPSSFSIADLKSRSLSKASRRSPSPSPLAEGQGSRGVRERGISPPIPITTPIGDGDEECVEELRDSRYIPGMSIYIDVPPPVPAMAEESKEVVAKAKGGLGASSSRSGLFNLSLRSKSTILTVPGDELHTETQPRSAARSPSPSGIRTGNNDDGSRFKSTSGFGLSLRTRSSIRSQKVKSPIQNVEGPTKSGVYRTPSGGIGNSTATVNIRQTSTSADLRTGGQTQTPKTQPQLLDVLVARDSAGQPQTQILSELDVDAGLEADGRRTEEREREKVRKVLEWRQEVGENEDIARLEERMRGFVVGEQERIRVIGRRSGSSDGLRV